MMFGEEWDGDGEMRVWIRALWGVSRCGMESIEIDDEFLSTRYPSRFKLIRPTFVTI